MPYAKPRVPRIYQPAGAPDYWALMNAPGKTHAQDAGDVADLTGRTASGVRSPGCTWTTGPNGQRPRFDGTGGTVTVTGLAPQTGSFAVTLRFKPESYGNNALIIQYGGNWRILFYPPGGNVLSFQFINTVFHVNSLTAPSLSSEHFLACYYDAGASQIGISLDGGAFATAACGAPAVNAGQLIISHSSLPYTGAIDDIRIFRRAPTPAEFASIYADPYWRLREPSRIARIAAALTSPPTTATTARPGRWVPTSYRRISR